MNQYLYTIFVLSMTITCMLFLTVTNEYMLTIHKKAFFVVYLGEFFITVCEVLSIFLNGSSNKFKTIHFLSNYFGFLFTPVLIIFFAVSIGRFQRLKVAFIGAFSYFIVIPIRKP